MAGYLVSKNVVLDPKLLGGKREEGGGKGEERDEGRGTRQEGGEERGEMENREGRRDCLDLLVSSLRLTDSFTFPLRMLRPWPAPEMAPLSRFDHIPLSALLISLLSPYGRHSLPCCILFPCQGEAL